MIRTQLFKARCQPQLETSLRLNIQIPAPHFILIVVLSGVFMTCRYWLHSLSQNKALGTSAQQKERVLWLVIA